MARLKIISFIVTLFLSHLYIFSTSQTLPASLVHNSQQEIDSKMGKLELKLIRTWGGDQDSDLHKFFKLPYGLVIDKNNFVYISDLYNFNVKVFKSDGTYVRTIGRKGRGPGDLFGPSPISIAPDGLIWIGERGGGGGSRRLMHPGKVKPL